VKRISDFQPNPLNPRTITNAQLDALRAAMLAYGDLSGLVVNLTTGRMIGGHQRVKILGDAPVTVRSRYQRPTARGTVAEGFVTHDGERFVYREVRWSEEQEKAAMIAANKHSGDWDIPALSDLLLGLEADGYDMVLTGFSAKELAGLIPDDGQIDALAAGAEPTNVRTVQLVFTVDTLPVFMHRVQQLGERFGTASVSDTVYRAVEQCYASQHGHAKTTPPLAANAKQRAKGGRRVQLDAASVGD
jgi:hypothetical protein